MGEYITIIWDAETPAAAAVPWDNTMLVVHGSEGSLSETTVYAVTNDSWSTVLANAGFSQSSQAYKSTSNFFAASPTPGGSLYVLALVSGSVDIYSNVRMQKVTDNIYETPIKPPLGFYGGEEVRYYPDAELTGYWVNAADGSQGVGFTIEVDNLNNWTGRLNFGDGLSGIIIDNPPESVGKITCSFRIGNAAADLSEQIEKYNINLLAVAYENSRTTENYTGDNTYFGDQSIDLSRFINAIAGKNTQLFWASPGGAVVGESGIGFGVNWESLRSFVGQREDFTNYLSEPSASNHDMGAGLMGMVAGTHPHTTMSFAVPHMGIQKESSMIDRSYLSDGQIISNMENRKLAGDPIQLSYGFTFGTGYSSRINYVRCKYIISQSLINGIWELLSSRTVRMSYAGMQLMRNKITGIFKTLREQGIHDGLAYVKIPIEDDLKNNTAAGTAARLSRTIPSIEIGFYWWSSLERIIITGIRNEA